MGEARQPSGYRRYVVPRDPLSALGTLRLLFEGGIVASGTALASRFVLPAVFGESVLFEGTASVTGLLAVGLGVAFAALLTITIVRVLWRW